MRRKFSVLLGLATCMLGMLCFTSCDPDDIDAFAEGYRYGYESQQSDDEDWKGDVQEIIIVQENN